MQKYYNFNVYCSDHGIPSKSHYAKVEINVLDVNDNPPVFTQNVIKVNIKEDTPVRTIITRVEATDADEGENGAIIYSLSRVDPNEKGYFVIDQHDGTIRLGRSLDREKIACFELEIEGSDLGTPSMSAKAMVSITIEDINDNAPFFPKSRKTYFVREDQAVGSIIGPIQAEDLDIGDNANLEYFLIPDVEANSMFYLDSATGELELMKPLDFEKVENYTITVQVFSGSLQTTEKLTIAVVDVNDNPPRLNDMNIIFNNFVTKSENKRPSLMEDMAGPNTLGVAFTRGIIGVLNYFEPDKLDDVTFGQHGQEELIKVNKTSGELKIGPNLVANREFNAPINVWVEDGKHKAEGTVTIEVKIITVDALDAAVVVHIADSNLNHFLQNEIKVFRDSIRAITKLPTLDSVLIIDVREVGENVEVVLAVRRIALGKELVYISRAELQSLLFLHHHQILPKLLPFGDSETCSIEPCEHFNICESWLDHRGGVGADFAASPDFIFRRLNLQKRTRCTCPAGYAGNLCQSPVNTCWAKPCQNGGKCFPIETGFRCECPAGTRGLHCEHVEGQGRCDDGPLTCGAGREKCQNLLKGGYECKCKDPDSSNKFCDTTTRSFSGSGYIMFAGLPNRWDLSIEFEVRTIDKDAVLLHNGRLSAGGDQISVLLRGGRLYVEFSTGGQTYSVFTQRQIASGNYEHVRIQYQHIAKVDPNSNDHYPHIIGKTKERRLFVQLGNCHINSAVNDCSAYLNATEKEPSSLDLTGPLFVGGVPSWMRKESFTGCIRNFHIDSKFIDLTTPLASKNSKIGCSLEATECSGKICQHAGQCRKFGDKVQCQCAANFSGKRCETPTYVNAKRLSRGYIRIQNVGNLRRGDDFEVSLQLRTATTNAAVLSWGGVQLMITNRHLSFKLGGVEEPFKCTDKCLKSLVADSEWHQIRMKSIAQRTYISVDDEIVLTISSKTPPPVKDIIIGDKQMFELVGCISGLKIKNLRSGVSESPPLIIVGIIKDGCTSTSKCSVNSCPKNADCIANWESVNCICKKGFFGPHCKEQCADNPCMNGGVCSQTDKNGGFECSCPTEFTGKLCERQSSCPKGWSGSIPGECRPCNCTEELGFANSCNDDVNKCECKENYYRPADQQWKCVPCNCDRLGANSPNCSATTGACECRLGVLGRSCDKCSNQFAEVTLKGCEILGSEKCPRSSFAGVQWDRISYGASQTATCPAGSSGDAFRECTQLGWGKANLSNCLSNRFNELYRFDQALQGRGLKGENIDKRELSTGKAVDLAEHLWLVLADGSSEPSELHGADIKVTYGLILKNLKFQNKQKGYDLSMTSDASFSSNLLLASGKMIAMEQSEWNALENDASINLLNAIANYAETVASNLPNTYTERIVVLSPENGDYLSFLAINGTNGQIRPSADAQVFFDASQLGRNLKRAATVFTSRRLASLLPLRFAPEKKGFKIPPHPIINSAIISIALYENYTLITAIPNSPILIRFALIESIGRSRAQCVFWSKDLDAWSPHGCYVKMENRTHVECSCTHLSTFAVLMDEGEVSVLETNPLKTVCFALIGVSIFLCVLCVLMFAFLSEVRSAQAHLHNALTLSLIALQLIFIFGINSTDHEYYCMIVSIGLHYFYLSTFTWCALETIHLYRRLSEPQFQIAQRADRQAIQLYYGCGLGLPAVIVATAVGLQPAGYGNARFCWLDTSDPLVGAMAIPIGLLLIAIVAGLVLSVRQYMTMKRVDIVKQEVRKDIRLLAFLTPILFAAWMSALTAVNSNSPVLFIIMVVLHVTISVFILLCYIVKSPEVKRAWKLEMTKKERRKAIHTATLLTGGPKSTLNYMNNTSSSETSKPYSDRFSSDRTDELTNRRSNMYKVKHRKGDPAKKPLTQQDSLSDSDGNSDRFSDSEGELLARKAKKANKKLRKQRGPSSDLDATSQSGKIDFLIIFTFINISPIRVRCSKNAD